MITKVSTRQAVEIMEKKEKKENNKQLNKTPLKSQSVMCVTYSLMRAYSSALKILRD